MKDNELSVNQGRPVTFLGSHEAIYNGVFQFFSQDSKETNEGVLIFPVAVIEANRGRMYSVEMGSFRFTDGKNNAKE